jgi:hypothetical protein
VRKYEDIVKKLEFEGSRFYCVKANRRYAARRGTAQQRNNIV